MDYPCTTCKHMSWFAIPSKCKRPTKNKDLVTGEPIFWTCRSERYSIFGDDTCGRDGKFHSKRARQP